MIGGIGVEVVSTGGWESGAAYGRDVVENPDVAFAVEVKIKEFEIDSIGDQTIRFQCNNNNNNGVDWLSWGWI